MIYPAQFEVKVGFDLIRQLLKEQCAGTLGQQFVDKLQPSFKFDTVAKLTAQTDEMVKVLSEGGDFTFGTYYNILPLLRKAEIENAFLDEGEWVNIRTTVHTLSLLYQFFSKQPAERFPELRSLGGYVSIEQGLTSRISQVIDDNGNVRDSASTELQRIRRELVKEQSQLRRKLDSLLKSLKAQEFVPDDAELTIRSGRLVIPLRAEQKRQIKGFIHDESATGQTVYMEPAEVVESNNLIRELGYEERREIIRILTQLTTYLRPQVPALTKACTYLGMLDFIRAKARFALMTDSIRPELNKQSLINWRGAKHPLLLLNFRKQGRDVVPLDLKLDHDQRILVISGPNAGGKSIALKTVALIQYMWQSGLLVPMNEGSEIGLFDSLFIDIGDEQSLENDLSTYSSHLKNMLYFTKMVTKRSLFLIDEMGTGTDPLYGGPIAEAILEELNKQHAFGVVNTHYSNLKELADRTKGIINGAMRFDAEHLQPMYQLQIGKPGSSFALEIARKTGFPESILKRASHRIGHKRVAVDQLLVELEAQKQQAEFTKTEAEKQLRLHEKYATDYKELKELLEAQRKAQLDEARKQAKQLIANTNKRIEQTIKEIRESQADKELTKLLRTDLQVFAETELILDEPDNRISVIVPELPEKPERKQKTKANSANKADDFNMPSKANVIEDDGPSTVEVGGFVRVLGSGAYAQVIAITGKDVEISIGELKSKVKMNRLEPISRRLYFEATKQDDIQLPSSKGIDLNHRMANFSFNLDLRGKRGVEALSELDQFMDSALLLGQQELRIVHGKGDGILRKLVRQHLRAYKQIAGIADEHPDRGGDGVTVVALV